jgi:Mg-chelatase subunit ChlI
VRVQGSPDLTSEDLIGDIDPVKALKHGAMSLEAFSPGKIFKANNGVLFFDEINRCPEKLQNALLQVLEERKLTIAGYDVDFGVDFIFVGTMTLRIPRQSRCQMFSGQVRYRLHGLS